MNAGVAGARSLTQKGEPTITTRTLFTSLCVVLAMPAGCATADSDAKIPDSDVMIQMVRIQRNQVDLVSNLRQQAKEFQQTAERLALETELLSGTKTLPWNSR